MLAEKFAKTDPLSIESTEARPAQRRVLLVHHRGRWRPGAPFRLNGNVRNDGYITNLPDGCCVEVPIYVDRHGPAPDASWATCRRSAPRST